MRFRRNNASDRNSYETGIKRKSKAYFILLIEQIAEPEFREKWKVNVADGSVIFGSAKDNWALSVAFMKKKGISFKDVINAYSLDEEERKKWFWDKAPLYEVLLDSVIKHLPNPIEA